MFDVPDEVLEKLKCSQCEYYLSTSPVMLKTSAENICGNCALPDNTNQSAVRNEIYEHLATFVLFPCCYTKEGCKERMLFDEIKNHESGCQHQPYECPMCAVGDCTWTGKYTDIKMHYEKDHPSLIADHPYHFCPNISSNSMSSVLIEVMNFLFLVQIQCNMAAAKLWYCVRFIGNPKFATQFEFTLDMDYQSGKITQKKVVQTCERLLLIKRDVIEVDITGLLKIVGGNDIRKINSSIQVNIKNGHCLICNKNDQTIPIYLDDNGYYCNKCIDDNSRIKCKNSKACNYEDMKLNMTKHELWLCKYSKAKCMKSNCRQKMIHTNETLIDHITREHIRDEMAHYPNFSGNLMRNILYGAVLYLHDLKFITNCIFNEFGFKYTIVSDLTKLETLDYKCVLKVINPKTGQFHMTELIRDMLSNEHDWIVIVKDNGLNDADGSIPKDYKCQISITYEPNIPKN